MPNQAAAPAALRITNDSTAAIPLPAPALLGALGLSLVAIVRKLRWS
jgi:hypothetical protein